LDEKLTCSVNMDDDTKPESAEPLFAPPARFQRWWTEFAAASGGEENPAVREIEKVVGTGWRFATLVALLPTILVVFLAIPLIWLADRLQRRGRFGVYAQWVLIGPVVAMVWIARILGWVLVVLVLWRFLTESPLRKDVSDTIKLFAGVGLLAASIPIINQVDLRLWGRFYRWGLGDSFARILSGILSWALLFALFGAFIYFGLIPEEIPWQRMSSE
jgi:hypothetical protein